jgi:Ca-activated chloride channel family protein
VSGAYEVAGLPIGTYLVRFELAGFKKVTRNNIAVPSNSGVRLDMKLEVGALTDEVTVSAAAPVVDTKKTTSGATFSSGLNVSGSASGQQVSLASRGTGSNVQWNLEGGSVTDLSSSNETARYAHVEPNRFNLTSVEPLSTFGADVDTASFANVRRFLNEGRLPPADAVRIEEFVNYFKFDYDAPSRDRAVSITSEVGECPWAPGHRLVLVGARAQSAAEEDAPRNLVFLIDVSGSMQPAERLPLLKTALAMFVGTLRPSDEISIVTYAGNSGVALRPTMARHRERILDAIASLSAGGSTNGAAGLMLAYRLARQEFVSGGVNRIILATDGDFNVGITGQRDLYQLIDREKRSGVFLSVLGVGTNNLQDRTMEMLADKGNGHYSYLDSLQEARRVLIREGDSTLETVAKDVKFQVEFNPAVVQAWRLIGYENRLMAHEAFNDDRKDGGELGAGHTVTVLYEVVPVGEKLPAALKPIGRPVIEPLVYQERSPVTKGANRDDLMTVRVRYKQPDESESVMFTSVVRAGGRSRNIPFAAAVAEFGFLLRDEAPGERRWDALLSRVQALPVGSDSSGERSGFARMVELAAGLRRLR